MPTFPVNVGLANVAKPRLVADNVPTVTKPSSAALRIFNASFDVSAHHMNAVVVEGAAAPELLLYSADRLLLMSALTFEPVSLEIF